MSMISIHNNPKIYFWAKLLGSISLLTPVMSLFYLHRGLVYSDFFILLLIIFITMFLFEVPTGAFADKYGPKASMIFGQSLAIISAILLIFANTKFEFYLISFLTGIVITFFSGCDEAFIYDSLKEDPIPAKAVGNLTRFHLMCETNYVETVDEDVSELKTSTKEEKKIIELSKDKKIFEKFANSIAPGIYGHEKIK